MPALHLRVTGSVQGVFFRAQAMERSLELGLKGWVRNDHDGSVEIHIEGEESALEKLAEWCNEGPSGAEVAAVEITESEEMGNDSFEVRYD